MADLMIDSVRLPYRGDLDEPFRLDRIADDLAEAVDDPTEREVMLNVAGELLAHHQPDTMREALALVGNASPEARRALLDRARAEAGLPSLTSEQTAERIAHPPIRASTEPARDGMGRVFAICSAEDCRNFLPGSDGQQIERVAVRRWYCEAHAEGHAEEMKPYTGPRLMYAPSGLLVDADEYDAEIRKAKLAEIHRENINAERDRARAADAARLATFQERRREADLLANRHQVGLKA